MGEGAIKEGASILYQIYRFRGVGEFLVVGGSRIEFVKVRVTVI